MRDRREEVLRRPGRREEAARRGTDELHQEVRERRGRDLRPSASRRRAAHRGQRAIALPSGAIHCPGGCRGRFMKILMGVVLTLLSGVALAADNPDWAYPVTPPPAKLDAVTLLSVPGSSKQYTQAQIDDAFNPPDSFPNEHPPMPQIITSGGARPRTACGQCHLPSDDGHPESANIAGLPANYIVRQFQAFKSGDRKGGRADRDADQFQIAVGRGDQGGGGLLRLVEAASRLHQGGRNRHGGKILRWRRRHAIRDAGWRPGADRQPHHRAAAGPAPRRDARPAFGFHRLCAEGQHRQRRRADGGRQRQDHHLHDLSRSRPEGSRRGAEHRGRGQPPTSSASSTI